MKSTKKWLSAAGVGIALLLTACSPAAQEETVLTIGDYELTKSEYYELLRDEPYSPDFTYGDVILEQHILVRVLEDKYGSQVDEEALDEARQEIIDSYGGEDEFKQALEEDGLSEEDIRQNSRMQALIIEAYKDFYPLDESKLEQMYEDMIPVGRTVRHILVPDKEKADEVIEKLEDGEDFIELVHEYSIDEGSLEADGELPLVRNQYVQAFEEAALELSEVDEYTEPVETDYGYHIIQLSTEGSKESFEEEKDFLETQHYENMMYEEEETYSEIMNNLLEEYESEIEIHDDALKDLIERIIKVSEQEKQQQEEYERMMEENLQEQVEMSETEEEITETEVSDEETE